jgi:hypothetical protein
MNTRPNHAAAGDPSAANDVLTPISNRHMTTPSVEWLAVGEQPVKAPCRVLTLQVASETFRWTGHTWSSGRFMSEVGADCVWESGRL